MRDFISEWKRSWICEEQITLLSHVDCHGGRKYAFGDG